MEEGETMKSNVKKMSFLSFKRIALTLSLFSVPLFLVLFQNCSPNKIDQQSLGGLAPARAGSGNGQGYDGLTSGNGQGYDGK